MFNSIFVHRAKDFHDQVRATCLQHLNDFILGGGGGGGSSGEGDSGAGGSSNKDKDKSSSNSSSKKGLRTEYLKYLGWACSDHALSVRLQAIKAIGHLLQVGGWFLCFLLQLLYRNILF